MAAKKAKYKTETVVHLLPEQLKPSPE